VLNRLPTAFAAAYRRARVYRCIALTCQRIKRGYGSEILELTFAPVPRARVFMTTPGAVTAQTKEMIS
jgi:hypothetical protein